MVELFRATEFVTRAALADSNPNTDKYNQSSWAILYGALADSLGLGPDNFQLVYPNIAWTWPVESLGYIGPAAYDAMSTIPPGGVRCDEHNSANWVSTSLSYPLHLVSEAAMTAD